MKSKNCLFTRIVSISGILRAAELRAKTGETNKLEMITARSQNLEVKNQLYQINADIGILSRKTENSFEQ